MPDSHAVGSVTGGKLPVSTFAKIQRFPVLAHFPKTYGGARGECDSGSFQPMSQVMGTAA